MMIEKNLDTWMQLQAEIGNLVGDRDRISVI
jgi:hypothetical protein